MRYASAILAGGASSRFGSDKALADLNGAPLIAHVAHALGGEALAVIGHAEAAAVLSADALSDPPDSVRGPLAGVLVALEWAEQRGFTWLVTAPCDAPLLPLDISLQLVAAANAAGADAALASTSEGLHPLCAAWRPSLALRLRAFFARGVHPPVRELAPDAVQVRFPDEARFSNVNTQDDLARVRAVLRGV